MSHVLIVDDEQSISWGLSKLAEKMGHTASVAASAEEGLEIGAKQQPDAIVLDVRLPGIDGLTAIERYRELLGPVPIVVITAYGNLATAVEAVRGGAFDYLTKPFDLKVAEWAIRRALASSAEPTAAPTEPALPEQDRIVGRSPAMQEVFKRIALVAASEACAHLRGESGTGKELVARAIHRYSHRAAGPFVAVNVASLSPSLAESELFGHVRGAFTGAESARRGLLEQADGGTIFLDEVADIPMSIQVKLLRVLEHGEVLPVGADQPMHVDFRVISATHQNLPERVAEGAFRHDLYYRLSVTKIPLPRLADCSEDIPLIIHAFIEDYNEKMLRHVRGVAPDVLERMIGYDWPGNFRELRNAIEHAVMVNTGDMGDIIGWGHLPDELRESLLYGQGATGKGDPSDPLRDAKESIEKSARELYVQALRLAGGNVTKAAKIVGVGRATFYRKMSQFEINRIAELSTVQRDTN